MLCAWQRVWKDAGFKMSTTEAHSPWQNRTKVEIRELKKHIRRWDFCALSTTDLRKLLVRPLQHLHGRTSYEVLTGNTPDISEFVEYKWHQPVWYYESSAFPEQCKCLARWIDIAH